MLRLGAVKRCRSFLFAFLVCVSGTLNAEAQDSESSAAITSHIPRDRVQSRVIAEVGYSKRRHLLEIEFVNGAIYRYLDVPSSVYHDLISAGSKARFYDFNIKGKYRSLHVRPRIKDKSAN